MKRIGFVLSIFTLVWMGVSALHLTNPYLRSSEFIEVSVIRGDSVWTIARKYAAKETMAEELEEAIIEVNDLPQAMADHKALDTGGRAPYNGYTE